MFLNEFIFNRIWQNHVKETKKFQLDFNKQPS